MEPKDVKIKVVSGNDYFGVRKNAFVVMHGNEKGKIHFDELEGLFEISEYIWEPPQNAKLSFLDRESNVGFTIEVACDKVLSSQILELNPVSQNVVEPKTDEKVIISHEEHTSSSNKKVSIFSVVGMTVGAICSTYGLVSAIAIQKLSSGRPSYSTDIFTELSEKVGTSACLFTVLLGILIICYFGNHLYKYSPNDTLGHK